MRRVALVVPGRLETRTGGYIYDRRVAEGLRALGWFVDVLELDPSFPAPTAVALEHAARALAGIAAGTIVLVDGLAFGAMPDALAREAARLLIVGLIHLPLAAAHGLDETSRARLSRSERDSLRAARLIVVTGHATPALLEAHGLRHARVVVVEPGTDPAPVAHGSSDGHVRLVSVATVGPGKGHETLLWSLARIAERDWHLTCAGSLTRHPETAARVGAVTRRLGLEDRVLFVGDLDRPDLDRCYDGADLFALATEQETYGMAVAEALARGLPVVSTGTGAIPTLVGSEAGLVVPPGDRTAFADALARAVEDADCRARLAAGAREVRATLPTWERASLTMAHALTSLEAHV